jgi:hypothetical protein
MSLSMLYELMDFHWDCRLSVSLHWVSIFSEPIDLMALLVLKEYVDSLRAYGFSLSLSIVSEPTVFLAYQFLMSLSIFSEPMNFHWAHRLSLRLQLVSIVSEPIDLLSLSIFKEHIDSLRAYGLSLTLSIFNKLSVSRQIYVKELPYRISWHFTACQ